MADGGLSLLQGGIAASVPFGPKVRARAWVVPLRLN
jgi:hypothetical protein